jgi:hypothetical protein
MTPLPSTTPEASEAIGRLCIGADWACAHGDLDSLREIAHQLASYVPEPIHCELVALASACAGAPDRATTLWDRLKTQLYREVRPS